MEEGRLDIETPEGLAWQADTRALCSAEGKQLVVDMILHREEEKKTGNGLKLIPQQNLKWIY